MRDTRLGVAILAALMLSAVGAGPASAAPSASTAATCSDYSNQREAQEAADTRDADGDGIYCESLPCPCLKPGGGGSGGGGGGGESRPSKRAQRISARITSVTDGDTIRVRAYGAKRRFYKVRLIGIDTPEVYGGTECGAKQASRYMRQLAFSSQGKGRRVTLKTDPTQDTFDRYGRLLAYVTTRGGSLLQTKMLAAGWAKVYVYGGKPFQQVERFRRAERRARSRGRGVWSRCGGNFHKPA